MNKLDIEKLKQDILKSLIPTLTEIIASSIPHSLEINVEEPPKKKRGRPKKIKEAPIKVNKPKAIPKFVREDISQPSTYVDDLSDESELIETDKIICKPHKKTILRDDNTIIRTRKCTRNKANGDLCGKEFEAFGQEYMCPKCATEVRKKNES